MENEAASQGLDAALFEYAACGLLQTAEDGTFLRANRTFCSWVGYVPGDLVGKLRLQDLLTMGGRIFHQTHWIPLLRMQGSVSEVKLEIKRADGHTLPMVLNALRRDRGGAYVHDIAAYVARDRDKYERELVNARKTLETALADAERLREAAKDRALFAEQMVGIVSHDLKNPISAIQMGVLLLDRTQLAPTQQRVVTRVTRAVDRAKALIADLLDFTQARLGHGLAVAREPFALHDSVGESVDERALTYAGRLLKHERVGGGECVGDANRLAQVVGNLVSNAMVYGKADLPVTVTSSIDENAFSVSVHNYGTPIPTEAQRALFEPMVRGTNATGSGRSVGLGLFIVREIAKAHGGRASVSSNADDGTTFRVTVPRA